MRTMYERSYLADFPKKDCKLTFPKHPKSYLQIACYEWQQSSMEEKVLDLWYLVTNGFNLKKYVAAYAADRPDCMDYIMLAFIELICYLRSPEKQNDPGICLLHVDDKISLAEAVSLFCKEVKLRYEQYYDYEPRRMEKLVLQRLKVLPPWDYDAIAKLNLSKEEQYELYKLPTDEYLKRINKMEQIPEKEDKQSEKVRFALFNKGKRTLVILGLNPSTADSEKMDPTMRKVSRIVEENGYDSFIMFNLYPLRATDPKELPQEMDVQLHQQNLNVIREKIREFKHIDVLAAFGNNAGKRKYLQNCWKDIVNVFSAYDTTWYRLGSFTRKGFPRHPLYQTDLKLLPFKIADLKWK